MGIPGFFSLIKQQYDVNRVLNKKVQCDALFIDTGSILHTCLSKCSSEGQVIVEFMHFLDTITRLVKPLQLLYIAFDGTPPFAKLKEQARRRKNNKNTTGLNSNLISPGTEFMSNFTAQLENLLPNFATEQGIKVIISPFTIKGEGEHKIFNYIRFNATSTNVIFGMDADLILLGLISPAKSVKILRMQSRRNDPSVQTFSILDVQMLRTKLLQNYKIKSHEALVDIVLIICILGNDFLPHPKNANVRNDLGKLLLHLRNFHSKRPGEFLVDSTGNINVSNFNSLIDLVYEDELRTYKSDFGYSSRVLSKPETERIPKEFDDYRYNHYLRFDEKDEVTVKSIIKDYLQGLQWVIKYYLNGLTREHFVFKWDFVPFISDLKIIDAKEIENIKLTEIKLKPIHHLAMILPDRSKSLLPLPYQIFEFPILESTFSYEQTKVQVDKMVKELDVNLTKDESSRNILIFEEIVI